MRIFMSVAIVIMKMLYYTYQQEKNVIQVSFTTVVKDYLRLSIITLNLYATFVNATVTLRQID